jgi:hypothetical protein
MRAEERWTEGYRAGLAILKLKWNQYSVKTFNARIVEFRGTGY